MGRYTEGLHRRVLTPWQVRLALLVVASLARILEPS